MLILAGIVFLHITTIILLLVATIDNVSGRSCFLIDTQQIICWEAHGVTLKRKASS